MYWKDLHSMYYQHFLSVRRGHIQWKTSALYSEPKLQCQQWHSFHQSQLQEDQTLQESHPHIDQAKVNRQIVTDLLASSKYKINIEDLLVKIVTSRNIKQEDTIAVILALLGCASMVSVKDSTESEKNTEHSETVNQDKE